MAAEKRLLEVLLQKLGKEISISEIGYKSIEFMREKVDKQLVPEHVVDQLAEPIIGDSANYTDDKGDYYTLISIETGNGETYEVWIINDKVVSNFT